MRMIVMFDLPVETGDQRRAYSKFRKTMIKNGFIMLQESVYTRLLTTPSVENSIRKAISEAKPTEGLVEILTVTEKQFQKMEILVGEYRKEVLDNQERVVIF